jgi:hypothetical protein
MFVGERSSVHGKGHRGGGFKFRWVDSLEVDSRCDNVAFKPNHRVGEPPPYTPGISSKSIFTASQLVMPSK